MKRSIFPRKTKKAIIKLFGRRVYKGMKYYQILHLPTYEDWKKLYSPA